MFTLVEWLFLWFLNTAMASISLNITGSPQLNVWNEDAHTKIYNYNSSPNNLVHFRCAYVITNRQPLEYYIITINLDGELRRVISTSQDGELLGMFTIHDRNNNITCEARPLGGEYTKYFGPKKEENTSYTCVVKLHHSPLPNLLAPPETSHKPIRSTAISATPTTTESPYQPIQSTDSGALNVPGVPGLAAAVAVAIIELIVIAVLIAIISNYRRKVKELESKQTPEFISNRPAMDEPSENVYDHVYSHGAGLRRPRLK